MLLSKTITYQFSGTPTINRIMLNILRHKCPGCNNVPLTYMHAGHNCGTITDPHIIIDCYISFGECFFLCPKDPCSERKGRNRIRSVLNTQQESDILCYRNKSAYMKCTFIIRSNNVQASVEILSYRYNLHW